MASQQQSISDLLKQALDDFPSAFENLKASVSDKTDWQTAIGILCKSKDRPTLALCRLRFLETVLDITQSDVNLIRPILTDKAVTSLSTLGALYSFRDDWPAELAPKIDYLRQRLFRIEPTGVLLAAIKANNITVKEDLRKTVCAVLDDLVKADLTLRGTDLTDRANRYISNSDDASEVMSILKTFQRLSAVAMGPEDINVLLKTNYSSASTIAQTSLQRFKAVMKKYLTAARAADIHANATTVDIRNEQAWISVLQSKLHNFTQVSLPARKPPSETGTLANFDMTNMFQLEYGHCEHCCSVVGLGAYLVDLLNFLQSARCTQDPEEMSPDEEKCDTVYQVFMNRRPDIASLALTCANTNTLVSYMTLANEVMESFVDYLAVHVDERKRKNSIRPYNTPTEGSSGNETTNTSAYKGSLALQMHPFDKFPYNQAIDSMKWLLKAKGVEWIKFVQLFSSPDSVAERVPGSLTPAASNNGTAWLRYLKLTSDRTNAAAILGLTQEDFLAITGESFWPAEDFETFFGISFSEDLRKRSKNYGVGLLWGYQDSTPHKSKADDMMTDDTLGQGLSFIKEQLLPRSGIQFDDLLAILDTQYMGGRLAIVPTGKEPNEFNGTLSDMMLRASALNCKPGKLDIQLCNNLQSFIRLQLKLNWPIQLLDKALSAIKAIFASRGAKVERHGIQPDVLCELASIKDLAILVGREIKDLLPLWADIDTRGKDSTYAKIFLSNQDTLDKNCFEPQHGTYLEKYGPLSDHWNDIMTVFEITSDELSLVCDIASLKTTDRLNLSTISSIYRHLLLCDILKAAVKDCLLLNTIFQRYGDPFRSPTATLKVVKNYKQVVRDTCSLQTVAQILIPAPAHPRLKIPSWPQLEPDTALSAVESFRAMLLSPVCSLKQEVEALVAVLFNTADAEAVLALINGTQRNSVTLTAQAVSELAEVNDKGKLPCSLFLQQDPFSKQNQTLVLSGTMSSGQLKLTLDTLESKSHAQEALNMLFQKSRSAFDRFILPLIPVTLQEVVNEASAVFLCDCPSNDVSTLAGDATSEMLSLQRQRWFMAITSLNQRAEKLQRALISRAKSVFPNLSEDTIACIANSGNWKIQQQSAGDVAEKALTTVALDGLTASSKRSLKAGLFRFPLHQSQNLTIRFLDSSTQDPKLAIEGVELAIEKVDTAILIGPVLLEGGRTYSLEANFDLSHAEIDIPSLGTLKLKDCVHLTEQAVLDLEEAWTKFCQVASLAESLRLTSDDLDFFFHGNHATCLSGTKIGLAELGRLRLYTELRDRASLGSEGPLKFLKWVSGSPEDAELGHQISSAMGWPKKRVEQLMAAKHGKTPSSKLFCRTSALTELLALENLVNFLAKNEKLANETALGSLFDGAAPRAPFSLEADFKCASTLRNSLKPSMTSPQLDLYTNYMQTSQRDALARYLLQDEFFRVRDIVEPDQLMDYFLIDVQMGYQLKTSRMKQAISSIQFFVQRCIYGLEVGRGVAATDIVADKWEWISKHNIWEMNRKIQLYPENWLDPLLRDDKTDLFRAFEATIMQNDLSAESATSAIRDYVCGLNEIADLDIQAYLRESSTSGSHFHFFARSKTLPPRFYYRRLDIVGTAKHAFWTSWTKLDIDIAAQDTDWDGKSLDGAGSYLIPVIRHGRLYLFMPLIMLKTLPTFDANTPTSHKNRNPISIATLAKQPIKKAEPKKFWEVRMGWSECVSGKWSPKKTSPAALPVMPPTDPNTPERLLLPSLAHFQFCISNQSGTNSDMLSIDVGCWYANKRHRYVGRFDLKDDRILAHAEDPDKSLAPRDIQPLETEFSRLSFSLSSGDSMRASNTRRYGKSDLAPVLAIPTRLMQNGANVTFTLSYNEAEKCETMKLCGLVVDIDQDKVRGETIFAYSRSGFKPQTTSENVELDSTMEKFDHMLSSKFMRALTEKEPVAQILESINITKLSVPENATDDIKKAIKTREDEDKAIIFGGRNGSIPHELSTPYALYNWELGVHCWMLIVDRFQASRQYDLALKFLRFLYNPTVKGSEKGDCWSFQVFKDIANGKAETDETILSNLSSDDEGSSSVGVGVSERRRNPISAHAAARARPISYMKRIIYTYVAILIAAGDEHFRQGSLEAVPLAIQRYIEARHILGPEPPTRPKLGKPVTRCFADLEKGMVDMELDFPFICELGNRGENDASVKQEEILCIVRTPYFCLPQNPEFARQRILLKDRLYKVRNSLDIEGRPVQYALVDQSLDPRTFGLSGGRGSAFNITTPIPSHRFTFFIHKALELCSDLRSISDQYLLTREKKDSENLLALRARQDQVIQKMMVGLKKTGREEIEKTIESLEQTRQSLVNRLTFHLSLIGESPDRIPNSTQKWQDIEQTVERVSTDDLRLTSSELREVKAATEAATLNRIAGDIDLQASQLLLAPNIVENIEPMGMGVSMKFDASNVAHFLSGVSSFTKLKAQMKVDTSARESRMAQFARQLQERRSQANAIGNEIKGIDSQIAIQHKRLEINEQEQKLQLQQIAHAAEVDAWYRTKFTNEELYGWAENSLRALHGDLFTLAMNVARQAEQAYVFERGETPSTAIVESVKWDPQREGLLAGQQLHASLKRMEHAYHERSPHDFEIAKSFSLRNVDPLALVTLRETGTAFFTLPEILFDFDFPGHYMRRIKTISITMPCLAGPYTSVAATLTLMKHEYRFNQIAIDGAEYTHNERGDSPFRTDRVPISSVALSTAQQDSGVFDLNFRDDRYLPFEGAGAISEWKLELPTEIRQFNYQTIGDVVLHMRYTARNGGAVLKKAASEAIATFKSGTEAVAEKQGLQAMFDIANDFPEEWYTFTQAIQAGKPATAVLDRLVQRLPFWARDKNVVPQSVQMVVAPGGNEWKKRLSLSVCGTNEWKSGSFGTNSCLMSCKAAADQTLSSWILTCTPGKDEKTVPERMLLIMTYKFKSTSGGLTGM